MDRSTTLREHVRALLTARQAHCTFEEAIADLSPSDRGTRPDDLPYSVWELVEHLRRAQRDILDYCRDPDYVAGDWPDDYWPESVAPSGDTTWADSVGQVQKDRDALVTLIMDEDRDLYDTVPSHDGHTYLREALLVADHNAYHIGQIVAVRRSLGAWPPASRR
ncbi:MAG: DinB family protein [Salinivenus sp.]